MEAKRQDIAALARRIRAIEAGFDDDAHRQPPGAMPTGWPEVDALLNGGLKRGAIHEWFAHPAPGGAPGNNRSSAPGGHSPSPPGAGAPPLCVLTHLAWQALMEEPENRRAGQPEIQNHASNHNNVPTASPQARRRVREPSGPSGPSGQRDATDPPRPTSSPKRRTPHRTILWIGRWCWPYGRALVRHTHHAHRETNQSNEPNGQTQPVFDPHALLRHSLFIDPPDDAARLWAIDLALRSSAVAAVIADGAGLDIAATRRLQLAAEAGRAIALLARPPRDLKQLSVAATRWRITPAPPATSLVASHDEASLSPLAASRDVPIAWSDMGDVDKPHTFRGLPMSDDHHATAWASGKPSACPCHPNESCHSNGSSPFAPTPPSRSGLVADDVFALSFPPWLLATSPQARRRVRESSGRHAAAASLAALLRPPRAAPRWRLELLRCRTSAVTNQKNVGTTTEMFLEWSHDKGVVSVPAALLDRLGRATSSPPRDADRRTA